MRSLYAALSDSCLACALIISTKSENISVPLRAIWNCELLLLLWQRLATEHWSCHAVLLSAADRGGCDHCGH